MMRKAIPLAALAVSASAQSSYLSLTSASVTSSASLSQASGLASTSTGVHTHTVAVALGGHKFTPDVTLAEPGDIIEFQFYPKNHSVIRAAYEHPCVPYEMVMGVGYYGFWSGWEPVDAVLGDPPSYFLQINDTEPVFFYCGAPNSCIGYQMVGVINPNASTSLQNQKDLAAQSSFVLVPGEDWPSEGSSSSSSAGSSSSATSSTSSPTASAPATSTTAAAAASSSHSSMSVGAIAGIAIGGAAVLLLGGIAVWFCGRRSNQAKNATPGAPAQETNVGYHPGYPPAGSMYAKPTHMSTVSGYGMPPNYEQGMRSPGMSPTPVDPMMGQQQQHLMHSGATSPMMAPSSPAYGHVQPVNMYTVGTHNVAPIEMSGEPRGMGVPRASTEKQGAERYC